MKIYLAARYSRREELCRYREILQLEGHTVTSRWLNGDHQIGDTGIPIGESGENLVEAGDDERAAALRLKFAQDDVEDVAAAGVLISFTETPRELNSSRGGRHVEFGYALALGKWCILVGPRENVFHWLNSIDQYDTFEEVLEVL
jgi:hypothetical protein